ncbi:MAG TPA: STAS domain-containing protein [Pseudonocardiaceae bacterium]|nr:STAS domain-containing protein [Pseudonocardiaceae bacterium]
MSDEPWCAGEQRPYPAGVSIITVALTHLQPRTTVCTVTGVINADTAPPLNDALVRAQSAGAHLVIDLSAVTSMDSDGLYVLLVARHRHRTGGGGHLAVVIDPDSPAIPELCIVSLKASFDLHHTVAEAFRACANTGIQP